MDFYNFKEKLNKQEVETLKSQLESFQADYNELSMFNFCMSQSRNFFYSFFFWIQDKKLSNVIFKEKNLEIENSALSTPKITTKQTFENFHTNIEALEELKKAAVDLPSEQTVKFNRNVITFADGIKSNMSKVSFQPSTRVVNESQTAEEAKTMPRIETFINSTKNLSGISSIH